MTIKTTLGSLEEGQSAKVTNIRINGSMRRRLQDLGITTGACIQCIQKGPSGDPIAFLVRGTSIALRSEDANGIEVSLTG